MKATELTLINEAITNSTAFSQLFKQYRPLVLTVLRPYHLRDFSHEDWLQEARIAMLKAITRYDGSSGSQFGPYYRMVLQSHLRQSCGNTLRINAASTRPQSQLKTAHLNLFKNVWLSDRMKMVYSCESSLHSFWHGCHLWNMRPSRQLSSVRQTVLKILCCSVIVAHWNGLGSRY